MQESESAVDSVENPLESGDSLSILETIMAQTNIRPNDEMYSMARQGIESFLSELVRTSRFDQRVEKSLVDQVIADIDERISQQVDQILHNSNFQKMESAWRGLKLVVDRTDFRENIELGILDASKEVLQDDFIDNPDICVSGLYSHIYTTEYGQFGGKPFGAIISNYDFGPNSNDVALLKNIAAVSSMAHVPFIGAAKAEHFGIDSYEDLPSLKDIKAITEGPKYTKWRAFRETEDSRYVGLTLPRFLLRLPYNKDNSPCKYFDYDEDVTMSHNNYLWGNTSFAFATTLTDSFAKYRWCPNIVGPNSGGVIEDLPLHQFDAMGALQTKIPTEALVSDRREYELSEEGFIALTMRKGSDNAAFFSANSVQLPKKYANTASGRQAEMNYKLGTELPYMFIITRLAHYIKTLQRENLGSWKSKSDLDKELNLWIRQYISDQENPPMNVRSRKPLRSAEITITEPEGEPGWYAIQLDVVPHFKYMGASFTLSLKGKLDKS
ncbi:MAG: type VI secretion system contractile sheath large subunit [Thiohalomonadales bacterium]